MSWGKMLARGTALNLLKFDRFFKISGINYSISNVSSTLKDLLRNYQDAVVGPFRVQHSGAFALSFPRAHLHVFPYCIDEDDNVIDPHFVDAKDIMKLRSYALDLNSLFCDDYHERCLFNLAINKAANYTELEITVMLTRHLFIPLISSSHEKCSLSPGVISKDSKQKIALCPCTERRKSCNEIIHYGSTGFGSGFLWHGKTDIMLFPLCGGNMNVIIIDGVDLMDEDTDPEINRQIVEVKQDEAHLRLHHNVSKATSQAITFSFLQTKYQRDIINNTNVTTLIPTIVAS